MKNYKQILFLSILFFSFTLLFSACDSPPQNKTQKKQNIVTKKIIPPDKKQKPVQPKTEQAQKPVEKPNQVENQKPKSQKQIEIKKTDKTKIQLDKEKTVVKKTNPENSPISENLRGELEEDKKRKNQYISDGKIDPFISPIKKRAIAGKKVVNRKLSPLEKLDLSQLKLVAVINMESKKKNIAMVQESSGKGYMVKVGTYIGTNNGRIIEIKNNEIILKERIENFNGVVEDIIKKMKLQKKR